MNATALRLDDWNQAVANPVTEPGVYDLPADRYLADPVPGGSLSASGARKLLPPSCPALFDYDRRHRPVPTPEFSFGHAAHKLVLGAGPDIVVVDADTWRTKAAQEARDGAYADGKTPLLPQDYAVVEAMAQALRRHPVAGALFSLETGMPEHSLFWRDAETGIMCRAMLDWLRHRHASRRLVIPDYKTAISASPERFEKAMWDYDYHRQAAWYLDGVRALDMSDNPAFVFVVQEKTPPYLVSVFEPDALALEAGRHYNRQARQVFAQCQASGHWPGYSDEVELISLPAYAQNKYFQETGL